MIGICTRVRKPWLLSLTPLIAHPSSGRRPSIGASGGRRRRRLSTGDDRLLAHPQHAAVATAANEAKTKYPADVNAFLYRDAHIGGSPRPSAPAIAWRGADRWLVDSALPPSSYLPTCTMRLDRSSVVCSRQFDRNSITAAATRSRTNSKDDHQAMHDSSSKQDACRRYDHSRHLWVQVEVRDCVDVWPRAFLELSNRDKESRSTLAD